MSDDTPIIQTRENGPLILKGVKTFKMPDGAVSEEKPLHALCRCGASKNKPYCDAMGATRCWHIGTDQRGCCRLPIRRIALQRPVQKQTLLRWDTL